MNERKEYNLFEIFMMLYFFTNRHFVRILIFSLIGICLGTGFYFYKSDTSKISIIANSEVINGALFSRMVGELQNTIELKDYELLSSKLKISNSLSEKIKDISSSISDKLESEENYYIININATLQKENFEAIDSINTSISNYFNTNKFIVNKLAFEKKKYENTIEEINKQLELLNNQNKNIVTNPQTEQSFYSETISLVEKRNLIESKLMYDKALTIIDSSITKNQKTEISITLFKFFAFFFVIGIFVSIYLDLKRKIKEHIKG